MRVFNINRHIFTVMGICPSPQYESIIAKLFRITIRCIMIGFVVIGTLGSVLFIRKFVFDDFMGALFAIFQIIGSAAVLYMWAVVYFSRQGISSIIQGFEAFHNLNDSERLSKFVKNANAKSDSFTKFYAIYVILGFFIISMMIGATQLSFIIYHIYIDGEIKPNAYTLPYTFDFPWNTKTPVGWVLAFIWSIIFSAICKFILATFVSFFVGICFYHRAFHQKFHMMAISIPHDRKNVNEIMFHLHKLIEFHRMVKKIFTESAEVYSFFLLMVFISSVARLSICTIHLDSVLKHPKANIFSLVSVIFLAVCEVFLYCYSGQIATESSLKFANSLFESNWPKFPVDVQKKLIPMIAYAQQPLYYHGFGIVYLNLSTFTTILRLDVSYYMMLKTLTMK